MIKIRIKRQTHCMRGGTSCFDALPRMSMLVVKAHRMATAKRPIPASGQRTCAHKSNNGCSGSSKDG